MAFIFGFVVGLYVGVLTMSLKFKKQLKKIKPVMPTENADTETQAFSASDLAAKTEED